MDTKVLIDKGKEQGVPYPKRYIQILCKVEEACRGTQEAKPGRGPCRNILLITGVLVIFLFMVLLLLWNYKCTIIDHLCGSDDEMETPTMKI